MKSYREFIRKKIQESFNLNLIKEEPLDLEKGMNVGDIMEGFYALATALKIANDEVTVDMINNYRKQINPAKRNEIVIYDGHKGPDKDRWRVVLIMRLKSIKTTGIAFGELFQSSHPKIDKKVESLVKDINNNKSLEKVDNFKRVILSNNKKDAIEFTVIADGLEGEGTGGKLKADVTLKIKASKNTDVPEYIEDIDQISFSLKSDSTTVANLSPYDGLMDMLKTWGMTDLASSLEKKGKKGFNTKENLETYLGGFAKRIEKMGDNQNFTQTTMNFLIKHAFGDDQSDIINITPSGLKFISFARVNDMKNEIRLVPYIRKQKNAFPVIEFYPFDMETQRMLTNEKVFHIRSKLRFHDDGRVKEFKMYVEVGEGAYDVSKKIGDDSPEAALLSKFIDGEDLSDDEAQQVLDYYNSPEYQKMYAPEIQDLKDQLGESRRKK